MKKTLLLAVCALFIGATAFAQSEEKKPTKEETIKWLTEKFNEYSYYKQYEKYGGYSIKIDACDIVINFTDEEGERYKYTFPTDFKEIDVEDGFMKYSEKSIILWFSRRDSYKRQNWFFLNELTPTAEMKKIEKAIHHLHSFCESEDLF